MFWRATELTEERGVRIACGNSGVSRHVRQVLSGQHAQPVAMKQSGDMAGGKGVELAARATVYSPAPPFSCPVP